MCRQVHYCITKIRIVLPGVFFVFLHTNDVLGMTLSCCSDAVSSILVDLLPVMSLGRENSRMRLSPVNTVTES